jgi:DnaJ-class molecular chaperone
MGDSYLLDEFKIHSGEVINPYRVLKVSRKADRTEIKQSYRTLSRRYHPDGNMHKREILPGSCNNWDEVRDHWERIKLAYEILSDPRSRKRYDRHEALADPSAAIQRAAVNAAFSGVAGVGKGIFSMGNFALNQLKNQVSNSAEKKEVSE